MQIGCFAQASLFVIYSSPSPPCNNIHKHVSIRKPCWGAHVVQTFAYYVFSLPPSPPPKAFLQHVITKTNTVEASTFFMYNGRRFGNHKFENKKTSDIHYLYQQEAIRGGETSLSPSLKAHKALPLLTSQTGTLCSPRPCHKIEEFAVTCYSSVPAKQPDM